MKTYTPEDVVVKFTKDGVSLGASDSGDCVDILEISTSFSFDGSSVGTVKYKYNGLTIAVDGKFKDIAKFIYHHCDIQLKEKEDGVLGEYILEHEMSFRAGLSTFTLCPGAVVDVTQEDNQHNKVLIVFDESTADWYHTSILNNFKKVKNK